MKRFPDAQDREQKLDTTHTRRTPKMTPRRKPADDDALVVAVMSAHHTGPDGNAYFLKEGDTTYANDPAVLRNPHLFIDERSTTSERRQAKAALLPVETNDSEGRVTSGRVPVKIVYQ